MYTEWEFCLGITVMCVILNPLFLETTRLLHFLTLSNFFSATTFIYSLPMSHYCLLFWASDHLDYPSHTEKVFIIVSESSTSLSAETGAGSEMKGGEASRTPSGGVWRTSLKREGGGSLSVEHDCLPLKKQKSFPLAGRNPSDILALQATFRA